MQKYDVSILGSGIAGSMLACILARKGLNVLLIEGGQHPRFAIGESTIPVTSLMAEMMGTHYDIPEIKALSSHNIVSESLSSQCGVKKGFGFIYHRPYQEHNKQEVVQTYLPHPETHLFRQDIDAQLAYAAVKYGATLKQSCKIRDLHFDNSGVILKSESGEVFQSDYIVDGCGFRSPLAKQFNLRESPPRYKTHSRSIFTHMIDVDLYDNIHQYTVDQVPLPWGQTTLHHLFHGGWMWVIPFNNTTLSQNSLCSVGLTLDPRIYPFDKDLPPEEEFKQVLSKFPSIGNQFKNAKSIRPWVTTGPRLQYSSSHTVGDRYCLLPHSSGFIDPLFSKGLAITTSVIPTIADRILASFEEKNFSKSFFQPVEDMTQSLLKYNDLLIEGTFLSFQDFSLFNCWWRIWLSVADWHLGELYDKYQKSKDSQYLPWQYKAYGWSCNQGLHERTSSFFNEVYNIIKKHDSGTMSTSDAVSKTQEMIRNFQLKIDLKDFNKRYTAPADFNGEPIVPKDYPNTKQQKPLLAI